MSVYFFDTSAIVKRYVVESGTVGVRAIVASHSPHTIFVSRITEVEANSAIARRQREGKFTISQATGIRRLIHKHFSTSYTVIDINPVITRLSIDLLYRHTIRAYDAIQLATVIEIHQRLSSVAISPIFACADSRLLNIALLEGLMAEDSNQY